MVKQSAPIHGFHCFFRHIHGLLLAAAPGIAHQENQIVGHGKLGCRPKAAPFFVKRPGKPLHGRGSQRTAGCARAGLAFLPQIIGQLRSRGEQCLPPVVPQVFHLREQRQQGRFGQIGPCPEGLLIGGQQHGQRPSARAVHGNTRLHIYRVHIGALFPVHFDGNKGTVDDRCHVFILKGLVCHHMAPVTGGISDAEENRLVLCPCHGKRLTAPGPPVHRVILVLKQIWGFFVLQLIGHGNILLSTVYRRFFCSTKSL